jgi:hypothetical protein
VHVDRGADLPTNPASLHVYRLKEIIARSRGLSIHVCGVWILVDDDSFGQRSFVRTGK